MSAILFASLPLFGCGDATDSNRSESGSKISAEVQQQTLEPDIRVDECKAATATASAVFESGLTNIYTTVTLHNNSAPNMLTGSSTNQDVTMNRYEVTYEGINRPVSIPPINSPGSSVLVPKDGSADMLVLVLDLDTLDYIAANYPSVGRSEGLALTATIRIWGEDAVGKLVPAVASTTLDIQNYNRCSSATATP
jgi:hypothetical protein